MSAFRSAVLFLAAALAPIGAYAAEYYAAALSGADAVPANATSARGFGRIVLDDAANSVRVALNVHNLSANYSNIGVYGPAAGGASGPLLFSLASGSDGSGYDDSDCGYYGCPPPVDHTSETVRNLSFSVTAAQKESLRAGQWYFAVTTPTYQGGEVRGQLAVSKPYAGTLGGAQVVPAVAGGGSASATLQLSPDESTVLVSVDWSGLSGAITAAHLHGPAAAGANGPSMITLGAAGGAGSGAYRDYFYAVNAATAQAIKAGQVYVDLHTAVHTEGEVRGQLSTALSIGPGISGNWYNPAQNGHGFQFEVLKEPAGFATAFWFVFDNNGKQVWISGAGQIDGDTLVLNSARRLGAKFPPNFNPAEAVGAPWGTLTTRFSDCTHGHVDWTTTDPAFTPSGSLDIERLTELAGTSCP